MYTAKAKNFTGYNMMQTSPKAATGPSSILVKFGEKIKPVKIKDIAYIKTDNKWVQLVTFHNETFVYNKTLEEMERACGESFYRVNRQVLLNRRLSGSAANLFP